VQVAPAMLLSLEVPKDQNIHDKSFIEYLKIEEQIMRQNISISKSKNKL